MQVVNIRQLKNNPATALRGAKEDDVVVVMNRDHPEAVLVSLDKLGLPDPDAVRVALAPGISAFSIGREYDHGGLSLQESVVPFMKVSRTGPVAGQPRLRVVSWNTRKTICSVVTSDAAELSVAVCLAMTWTMSSLISSSRPGGRSARSWMRTICNRCLATCPLVSFRPSNRSSQLMPCPSYEEMKHA